MPNKTKPKSQRMGYELLINPTGENGQKNWIKVAEKDGDGLFPSSSAAARFREEKFPQIKKYIIRGVRAPYAVLGLVPKEKYTFLTEKKVQKGNS